MMASNVLAICYLLGSVTFIVGLKMLSDPARARRGNGIAAVGMTIAIAGTIFLYRADGAYLHNYAWIFGGLIVGAIVGTLAAKRVQMTAMPEMVSVFNGMGGACAALISVVEFDHLIRRSGTSLLHLPDAPGPATPALPSGQLFIIMVGLIIGTVSFAGSMIAWGKLGGKIRDFAFRGQHILNLVLLVAVIAMTAYLISSFNNPPERVSSSLLSGDLSTYLLHFHLLFYAVLLLAAVYGVFFVLPIGGADMPVVISLLNSLTGTAAACGGFLYNNKVMLTGGILVGAAGTLLTILMCRAMNRSLANVLIGSFGGHAAAGSVRGPQGAYKEINISDAATVLNYASRVLIVPGYGLAVAQAQHVCHELEKTLSDRGVEVLYAIHPVAGRMPGHMNVLLAEADVSYDRLLEMEQANELFPSTDVVLVLGANDVVNPAAKTDPASPIYGMPILDVDLARMVIVNKRSMKPGYAGIENDLFFQPKTSMLFGDAKSVLQQLVAEIKTL